MDEPNTNAPQTDMQRLQAQVQQLTEQNAKRELTDTLGVSDPKQLDAIRTVQRDNPKLTPAQARAAAIEGSPEVFQQQRSGYQPGMHASLRPTMGGPLPEPTLAEKSKAIGKLRFASPALADQQEKQLHASLLIDALRRDRAPGWS